MNKEQIGSCKTLTINIVKLRLLLGRRGPWKNSSLRVYHDELLCDLAALGIKRVRLERVFPRS